MKILLCNDSYPLAVQRLENLLPDAQVFSCAPNEVMQNLAGVDVIIPSVARITSEIIERGTFGFIQQLGVGLDPVDIDAATKYGVWVARVPGAGSGNAESVAELAIMFMLTLARRLTQLRKNLDNGIFFKPTTQALLGKTVCIVGLGDIGTCLAKRLQPFGVKLKAVRKRIELAVPEELCIDKVYPTAEIEDAVRDADYVVLALPETGETRQIVNAKVIAAMKQGSYLVNVARGGVLDTDALLSALQSGHIAGAGLDVFWEEPVDPKHPLFSQNVVATPHIGGNTDVSFLGITTAIADNVKRYASGETPLHLANHLTVPLRRSPSATICQ
jgi:phosphoglycerate dehydrogenase-like enzyme